MGYVVTLRGCLVLCRINHRLSRRQQDRSKATKQHCQNCNSHRCERCENGETYQGFCATVVHLVVKPRDDGLQFYGT